MIFKTIYFQIFSLGVPVIGFFEDENDSRLIKFAEAANGLGEEFQFHHVYGKDVAAYGGKMGNVRVAQPPHFHSKYEKGVRPLLLSTI